MDQKKVIEKLLFLITTTNSILWVRKTHLFFGSLFFGRGALGGAVDQKIWKKQRKNL